MRAVRIALVHMRHARIGGTEQILDRFAAWLAGEGHEVTIVCRSHVEPPHPAVRFVVLRSRVPGNAARMWAFARDVEAHVRASDHDVVVGLGKTWTHDVVRSGGGSHRTYLEMVAAHHAGKRGLFGGPRLKDRLALRIEERAYAPGAYRTVVANSEMVRRDLQARHGIPDDRIEIVHNGVDLARFHPGRRDEGRALRRRLGLDEGAFVLLFVGGGFRRKGLGRLLRAMAGLRAERPDARLLVVGGDATRREHERLAAALGLLDVVRFLGRRGDPEVCYAAADLAVLPSFYDSFGFVVLEAMASGLPVVTTDRVGAAELVASDAGAVLGGDVEPRALAAALAAWCEPERAAEAGRRARRLAEREGFEHTLPRFGEIVVGAAVPS